MVADLVTGTEEKTGGKRASSWLFFAWEEIAFIIAQRSLALNNAIYKPIPSTFIKI